MSVHGRAPYATTLARAYAGRRDPPPYIPYLFILKTHPPDSLLVLFVYCHLYPAPTLNARTCKKSWRLKSGHPLDARALTISCTN